MQKIHLIVIDPQLDFCHPDGSLYVPGGDENMKLLAAMIMRLKDKLADIHVTLDSHHKIDISHKIWYKNSSGQHPAPFTQITAADLESGVWTTTQPNAYTRTLDYLRALETNGRYPQTVWPDHCLIGSSGHMVDKELFAALKEWEDQYAVVDFVTKGSNIWSEHFSILKAEIPCADDPSTQINTRLINTLEEADITVWTGLALSHCLANSVRDVADNFSAQEYIEKMVLLTDATGNVPGFESYGDDFIKELTARGMKLSTTVDFLA